MGKKMNALLATGIVAGLLAAVLGEVGGAVGMLTWVAFISWRMHICSGGRQHRLYQNHDKHHIWSAGRVVDCVPFWHTAIPFALGISYLYCGSHNVRFCKLERPFLCSRYVCRLLLFLWIRV